MKIRVQKVNSGLTFTILDRKLAPLRKRVCKSDINIERLVSKVADMYFSEVEVVLKQHNLPIERFQKYRYELRHSPGGAVLQQDIWGMAFGTFEEPRMNDSGSTATDHRARMLLAYQAPLNKIKNQDNTYSFFFSPVSSCLIISACFIAFINVFLTYSISLI